jgi:hypothetical protein
MSIRRRILVSSLVPADFARLSEEARAIAALRVAP